MLQSTMDNRSGVPAPVALPYSNWSKDEQALLKKLWPHEWDHGVIDDALPGRTLKAIEMKAKRLRLFRPNINEEIQKHGFLIDQFATEYILTYLEESK